MTREEFRKDIDEMVAQYPKDWRKGQAVFNCIDSAYGVARYVQFHEHIDCFYNDNAIDDFINASYDVINENEWKG